jgi:hypothetical protein
MSSLLQNHLSKRRLDIPADIYPSAPHIHGRFERLPGKRQRREFSYLSKLPVIRFNRFGGYTGMRPQTFWEFVLPYAAEVGLS